MLWNALSRFGLRLILIRAMKMSEDVVYRLRHAAWLCEEGSDTSHLEAAAAEILRLREAGDALVAAISESNLTGKHILAWEEARRG